MRVQYQYSIKLFEGVYFTGKTFAMSKDTQERVKTKVLNYFSAVPKSRDIKLTVDDVTLRKVV